MAEESRVSAPLKLTLRLLFTIALVWILNTYLDRYFSLYGGLPSYIIIGSLLTILNVIARPVLTVLLLPFKLFAVLPALIAANALFLWLTQEIAARMDPSIVRLSIDGGWTGWLLVALILGFANWMMKGVLK